VRRVSLVALPPKARIKPLPQKKPRSYNRGFSMISAKTGSRSRTDSAADFATEAEGSCGSEER